MGKTIIDAFVVALGLDASKFKKEADELETADKKAKDAAVRRGKELEASNKKQRESFTDLTKATLAAGAAFLGIQSVTSWTKRIIDGDAQVGRLSRTLGQSTGEISAWQGVLRGAGGTAEDAAADLGILRKAYEDIRLTGQSSLIPFLNLLSLSLKDIDDPSSSLLKVADAFSRMDPTQAAAIGQQMGFSPAMVSTLQRGKGAVTELLNEQYRLGVTTEASAKAAEEQQRQQAVLEKRAEDFGRKVLTAVLPALESMQNWLIKISQDKTFTGFLSAAGKACVALGNLAAPVFHIIGGLIQGIARLLSGDFSGAWRTVQGTVKSVVDSIVGFLRNGRDAAVEFWNALRGGGASGTARPAGGDPGAGPAQGAPSNRFDHIVKFFTDRGYPLHVARGIAAGIWAESKMDPKAFNPAGGGKGAYGVGQWRGQRQRELFRRYGSNPTLFQQLEYMNWELNGGNGEKAAGDALRGAGSDKAALDLYVKRFMRPAPGAEISGDLRRGQNALAKTPIVNRQTSLTVGQLTVQTQATDARGIAQSIVPALADTVPQANLGVA